MASKRKKNSDMIRENYLPQAVWAQHILPRLPVKTLLRFRCVCKYWCSVIDEPDFIYVHLKLYKNNYDKNQILAMEGLGHGGYKGSRFTIRGAHTLRKTSQLLTTSESCRMLGSCNGLVLLQFCGSHLKLWNPSVKRCMILPPNPFAAPRSGNYLMGYAPLSADYKVVGLEYCYWTKEGSLVIYSLNGDFWTTKICTEMGDPILGFLETKGYLYFEGAAYWFVYDPYNSHHFRNSVETHLAFFDFDTEELSYVELPDAADGGVRELYSINRSNMARCLFLLGESLAVFSISPVSRCVWVMEKDEKKRSWRLWFSGNSSAEALYSFKDEGRYQNMSRYKIFLAQNSGTSFIYGKNSCKITDHHLKPLGKTMSRHITLEPYLESLVLSRDYADRSSMYFP